MRKSLVCCPNHGTVPPSGLIDVQNGCNLNLSAF
jgi:hypothetical protein